MTLSPALYTAIANDPYAQYIGATLEAVQLGAARMSLVLHPHHMGPHGKTHGGAIFSLTQATLSAAAHSYNIVSLALTVNITFHSTSQPGDTLTAEVSEQKGGGRIGSYRIQVLDQHDTLVASGQALVYRTGQMLVEN